MPPRVAVITPCYNAAPFITDCIRSVQVSKTFGVFDLEHIIVDDGSTDESWSLITATQYQNVTTYQRSHGGSAAARNFALTKTDADHIFQLDADDVLFQASLCYLVRCALETGREWIYGDFIRGGTDLQYEIGNDYYGWPFDAVPEVLTAMFTGGHFFQHSSLYSTSLCRSVGGYDEGLVADGVIADDFPLFTRFLLHGVMPYHLPGPLYVHRNHDRNLSIKHQNDPEHHRNDVRKIFLKYRAQIDHSLNSEQRERVRAWMSKVGQK